MMQRTKFDNGNIFLRRFPLYGVSTPVSTVFQSNHDILTGKITTYILVYLSWHKRICCNAVPARLRKVRNVIYFWVLFVCVLAPRGCECQYKSTLLLFITIQNQTSATWIHILTCLQQTTLGDNVYSIIQHVSVHILPIFRPRCFQSRLL